ncbi:MAG: PQQ-like beta-propeller repeat protein [Tannerella sp.]|jgi:outer membrane protein assembly factor BamB|nr:PQQ-like beta-propeller repeat protein [Tannerella sp.]
MIKMTNIRKIFIGLIALSAIINVELKAQDWPQLFGPDRNHTSPQKGLLRSWPESGLETLWSVELGRGFGGPVAKNGKVYLLDRDDKVGDMMRCFSLQTGEELWKYGYNSPGEVSYPGSRSVPAVDDRHVYSVGPNGDLYCIDLQTHQPVWKKNIWTDFGGTKLPMWGISQSPMIYGDLLVTVSQAPQAGVVAYNKNTGDIIWQTPNLGNETYVSPKVIKIHGEDHIVMVTSSTNTFIYRDVPVSKGNVTGLEPRTGKILWQYTNWECVISVPCPVDAGDNRLLIVGGYDRGATMIKVNKKADGTFDTSELFTNLDFGDQTKPPLFHNGYFYAMYRTNQKREGLMCMNMNGEIMWKTGRNPDFERGSMIFADGLILAFNGFNILHLIEPVPTAFKPVAQATMPLEGSQNWGPMALADGKLLMRDQSRMICVKVDR